MTAAVLRKKSSCFFLPENRTPGTDDRQGRNGFADQGSGERRENGENVQEGSTGEKTGKAGGAIRKTAGEGTGRKESIENRKTEGKKNQKADWKRRQENGGRERGFCHAFETTKPYCVKKTEKT
jgi:hypothetical protein